MPLKEKLSVFEGREQEREKESEAAQGTVTDLVLRGKQNNVSGNLGYTQLTHEKIPFL